MKRKNRKKLYAAIGMLAVFLLWTVSLLWIDVQKIGESAVGFATLNGFVHDQIGVNMTLYTITDWLGLVPFGFVLVFGVLGLVQWIKRKHFLQVDQSLLILGGFYLVVMGAYLLFEIFPVNYRPVLINGALEASYPSSTTMLVMCVIPTGVMQLQNRIAGNLLRRLISALLYGFLIFMVLGRILAGVHWITDIIGGALLSTSLVQFYCYLVNE